jgi:hypothetical protein
MADYNLLAQLLMGYTPPNAGDLPATQQQPTDWGGPLAALLGQQQGPGQSFNAPPPVGSWNLPAPNFHGLVESQRAGERNRYSGGMSVPVMGGDLGVTGSYFKADRYTPADWQAMMNYKKRF